MNKIKVLQVCYSLKAAGIETYVTNLQEFTSDSDFEIHFLVYKNNESDMFYRDRIINSGGFIKNASSDHSNFLVRHIKQRFKFCKIIRNEKYKIVYINASSGLQGLEVFLAYIMGIRNIVVHSHSSNLSLSTRFNFLKKIIHKLGLKIIENYATTKIACSEKAANWMFSNQSKVKFVRNGIITSNYTYDNQIRNKKRTELQISSDQFVVGHIGAFSEIKNHEFIIEVFLRVLEIETKSILLLIGEGKLKENIISLAKKYDIESNILFLGVRNDCNELLMAMDSFIFPSLWEGFPITLIEAQASGVQCLVSDTITRQVQLSDKVIFLSLEDSCEKWAAEIINHDRNYDRICYSSIIKDKGFDIESISKDIEKIYKKLGV